MEDAAFLLGTVVLKPEDTLHSLGCRDEEEVVVRAVPRADQEAATAAVPSAAPPAAAAELEESSAKVSVKVLAEGADGVNELCFSVRMTTPLGKMMKAWCDHHQVPAGEAAFLLGEQLVKPEDTLLTLGSGTDAVVFRAVPRDHADAKEATPKKRGPKPKSPKPKEKAEKVAKGKGKGKGKSKGKRKGTEEAVSAELVVPTAKTTVCTFSQLAARQRPNVAAPVPILGGPQHKQPLIAALIHGAVDGF
ncbi:unnamed protein product [Symbiodinium microadriaticum]|nr:unnamed protein product [Symbiodinium microadriaticum]